jgi:hypothetical protein
MPVPATKPCSSAFMCVTETPDGFFTPLDAQPATSAAIAAPQTGMDILLSNSFMIL